MPNNWKTYTLGDLIKIKHGFAFKGKYFTTDEGKSLLLTPGNFEASGGIKFNWSKQKYYTGDYPSDYILSEGDLIIALTDLTQSCDILGSPAVIKDDKYKYLHNQRLGLVTEEEGLIDKTFLYYYFNTHNYRRLVQNSKTGSTVSHTAPERIYKCEISLPPLPEQRAIASILSTIDDQIENNLTMNKTLEEMAMALYKHWFVDFGPFQEGNFVESELGKIPEGWEVSDLNSIIHLNPRLSIKKGEVASFVEMKVVPEDAMSVSNVAKKEFKSGTKFQNGDTLFARITPCLENGKTAFVDFLEPDEIAFGSTEFLILRAQEGYSKYWNYCLSRTDAFRSHAISCMVGTSGRQRVQNVPMMNFLIALAPKKIYQEFELKVDSLFQKIRLNTIENQTLIEQRDALLPKLVSGEARVKGFE